MENTRPELEVLQDIRHYTQVGFMTTIAVLQQIREGKKGSPSPSDLEDAANLLRRASASLPRDDD